MRPYLLFFCLGLAACRSSNAPEEEEAPLSARPNILFCIADDASFPHMGAYGCAWVNTPGFDRVAREGLLFTRAYTPNAKCAPSRSCILTGRNSWQLEEAVNHWPHFPAKFTTYAEALADHGYHVGYTAKGWAPGNPGQVNGQRRQLTGTPYNAQKTTPPTAAMSDNDYAANFADFLDARPDDAPFCFWYGSTEPHRGYDYGSGLRQGNKQLSDIDAVPAFWPDTDSVRTDMLDYAYEIEYFDQHLQRMLALLEERGELDNTLVVVTADNGMPFPRIKGQAYEYSNHLPLAVMWKNGIATAGETVDALVSFIDFAPTFLEVAGVLPDSSGVPPTRMQPITGRSLTDILSADDPTVAFPQRDRVLIGKERHDIGRPNDAGYPIRGVVTDDFLYLQNYAPDRWPAGNPETGYLNTDGGATKTVILNQRRNENTKFWEMNFGKRPAEELYQIGRDPACVTNLANSLEHQGIKEQLRTRLLADLKKQDDPRVLGNGAIFETYEYADSASQNFYERYMAGEDMKAGWVNASDFEEEPLE